MVQMCFFSSHTPYDYYLLKNYKIRKQGQGRNGQGPGGRHGNVGPLGIL